MRTVRALLLLALGLPAVQAVAGDAAGGAAPLRPDYTRPESRDVPIRCKEGDVEYFAGQSMGDVFGAAWPAVPAARVVTPPRVVQSAPLTWPKGLGQGHAVAVVAILVGADDRAVDARAICASMPAIANPAVRAALRSTYETARFDGVPAATVVVRPFVFRFDDAPARPGRRPRP